MNYSASDNCTSDQCSSSFTVPAQDPVVVSDITDEVYSVSMQLSYAMEHGLTLSLGTSKGNLITQVGTLDLAFFDEDLSQYYISLGYLF